MSDTGRRIIVIGIGNPDRGDDAAGRAVARWLHGKLPPAVEIVEHDGEASTLLARLEGAATAYLIDACASGASAGTIRRFDAGSAPLPQGAFNGGFNISTHGLGLAEAVELARAFGQLPDRCIVYAIEAASFEPGAPLSPPVAAAVAQVGNRVRNEICGPDGSEGQIDS
jgi:hydrogenase maturation protease